MNAGETIRKERERKGFTQARLAKASGIAERTIQNIEAGRPAQAETMLAICSVLEIEMEALGSEAKIGVDQTTLDAMSSVMAHDIRTESLESRLYIGMFLGWMMLLTGLGIGTIFGTPWGILTTAIGAALVVDCFVCMGRADKSSKTFLDDLQPDGTFLLDRIADGSIRTISRTQSARLRKVCSDLRYFTAVNSPDANLTTY